MKTWIGALGLALGLAQTVAAQESETPPPWQVACSSQTGGTALICEMTQTIVLTENNQRLTSIAFLKSSGEDTVEVVLTLPFGLLFSEGIVARVDETAVARLEFLTCEAQGCFARSDVSTEWLAAMRAGNQLTIETTNRIGEPITFGFDLVGFSQVSDLMP